MSAIDWGPLPQLMHALAPSTPRAWCDALDRPGGIWSAAAAATIGDLWPATLPSPSPMPRRRSRRMFGGWRRWLRVSAYPRAPRPVPVDGEEFLRRCHAWIGRRNLERVCPLFVPFSFDTPAPLAIVSGQGLVWSAAVCHLDRWGPAAFLADDLPLKPAHPDGVLAGDCLALHFGIEDVVATLPERLGLAMRPVPDARPGGLRTPRALSILSALTLAAHRPYGASAWRSALGRLIAISPVTRLVYADICAGMVTDSVGQYDGTFRAPHPSAADDGWLEVWRSQLARSVLGAVLSPPLGHAELREAQQLLDRATASRGRHAQRALSGGGVQRMYLDWQVELATAERNRLQAIVTSRYQARLPFLGAALPADTAFHRRFVDMAVREITRECVGAMIEAWRRLGPRRSPTLEARDHFFFGPDALCFKRLEERMFGADTLAGVTTGSAALRAAVGRLRPADTDEILREVPGVALPVHVPFGYPPSHIWREWVTRLGDRLPREDAQTETSVEQIAGDAA